jgi:hypothetical protein
MFSYLCKLVLVFDHTAIVNIKDATPLFSNLDSICLDLASQPNKKQILSRMDHFLTLLVNYQKQMEYPKIRLKETATIVSQMVQQTQKHFPVLENLPEVQNPLKAAGESGGRQHPAAY